MIEQSELVKIYELDPRSRRKIREIWIPEKIWKKLLKEKLDRLKGLGYV
jgi:hypothetical protein